MGKLIAIICSTALLVGAGAALALAGTGGAHKVTICHFGGHESERGQHDFFVDFQFQVDDCDFFDGRLIRISRRGAVNGHGAVDRAI